jgi:CBS domain containing-hemolysin-like protein
MSFADSLFFLMLLVAGSVFFSLSEISLAASRKIKLQVMADEGNRHAEKVLALQAQPGNFFTVVQIGLNTVAILGGIWGSLPSTRHQGADLRFYQGPWLGQISSAASFVFVTGMFILIADLMPKRLAMTMPERIAVVVVRPMMLCVTLLMPLVWLFNGMANGLFRLMRISMVRNDEITSDDIYAVMDAGAEAGVIQREEHQLIENVFELQSLGVTSAMTARRASSTSPCKRGGEHQGEDRRAPPQQVPGVRPQPRQHQGVRGCQGAADPRHQRPEHRSQQRLPGAERHHHSRHPQPLRGDGVLQEPSRRFCGGDERIRPGGGHRHHERPDEYRHGEWATHVVEEQIVQRDENSWLVDGVTPISDVMRAFDIEEFPENQNYETIAGFIMYMLRKIPKRTDSVKYAGYKFEVVDIDSYKIDQLLVTRVEPASNEKPAQES